ncbi:hypothetical protein TERTU_3001 [Teredinibacter turnerae T7901]|uniref:Uncharacterized protein n=1 Tax=Teredinibacter turnerae (strain ATCC 39867 / T7901) TaxID=377629 RepID=C5BNK5_TERTT|nr:hypothetical protein TERTU_3001 [Teredinibacter turnerae T7901]
MTQEMAAPADNRRITRNSFVHHAKALPLSFVPTVRFCVRVRRCALYEWN